MGLKTALKEQFHAGLAMLAQCIDRCPEDLWTAGDHPRTFWRIAFHAAFFTQLGIGRDEAAFQPFPTPREDLKCLWEDPGNYEPYELPEGLAPLARNEMLEYFAFVDELIDSALDELDLYSPTSGFPWYRDMSKMSNVLMNLRHLQGHVGQLSELLMMRGIDIDWIGKGGCPS